MNKQTYNLGRIYAALANVLPEQDTPERRGAAPLSPLKAAAEMINTAVAQKKLAPELDTEIAELYDTIPSDYPSEIPLEDQGNWWLGYYHRKQFSKMTIKEAREKLGLTQEEVAERMGISQPLFANWESGGRKPKEETIQRIADALGIPRSDLL
jgi:DNA-binding XRE family transcriptional regulator